MRKHFYLITEHEDEDRVGAVKVLDSRLAKAEKNEETEIHKHDEDAGEFYTAGKHVHLGYADFDDEDDFEDNAGEVISRKLADIDDGYIGKAGLSEEVVASA